MLEHQASSFWSLVLVNFQGPLENEWTPSQMNTFCSCHRSQQRMNTSGSEHLVSQVTTHEHLVEIVQYLNWYCQEIYELCQNYYFLKFGLINHLQTMLFNWSCSAPNRFSLGVTSLGADEALKPESDLWVTMRKWRLCHAHTTMAPIFLGSASSISWQTKSIRKLLSGR